MAETTVRISRFYRLLTWFVIAPALMAIGGYVLVQVYMGHTIGRSWMAGAVIFGLGVLSPFFDNRYRLTISDTFIEQRYWRTTRIQYANITEVEVRLRSLVFKSRDGKFETLGVIERRGEIYKLIAGHLLKFRSITFTGDKSLVEKFLSAGR